jgi:hypothetical protein
MWAVGTLVETTLDVNLVTLWTRGIIRISVSMVNPKALEKHVDVSGPYNGVAYVVKLKLYEFFFHREASYFVPDPTFVPYFWRLKTNDVDDEGMGEEKEVDGSLGLSGLTYMVTSDQHGGGCH